jgi:hypothetical protein
MSQIDPAEYDAALQRVIDGDPSELDRAGTEVARVLSEGTSVNDLLFAQVLLDIRQRLADLEARLRRLR